MVRILFWINLDLKRLAAAYHQRIQRSGLVERLAEGTDWIGEIYNHTTPFWALIGLGPRPRKLQGWVRLLAMNIDWYLAEPRRIFRFEWVLMLGAYVMPVVGLLFQISMSFTRRPGIFGSSLVSSFFLLTMISFVFVVMLSLPSLLKRRMAADVLHRIMRQRFDA